MFVRLKTLYCEKTGSGERTEEPYLHIFWSGMRGQDYYVEPQHLRDGNSLHFEHQNYTLGEDEYLEITLYDSDTPGMGRGGSGDDRIGFRMRIDRDHERGSFIGFFGDEFSAGNSSGSGRSYRLFYDVTDNESDELEQYCLKLSTLRCIQSHESGEDEVFININGRRVWGPENMEKNQTVTFHVSSTTVTSPVQIDIWERDPVEASRNDFMGTRTFTIGTDTDLSRPRHWEINYDRGPYRRGSNYCLYYSLTRRRHTLGGCGDEHPR